MFLTNENKINLIESYKYIAIYLQYNIFNIIYYK